MKSKILFTIFGIIFLLGSVLAGGILLSERNATLTSAEKTELISSGIKDVQVTALNCKDTYCTYWIKKANVINSERRIEMYKDVCTTPITKTDKEVCDEPVCTIEYGKEICQEQTEEQIKLEEKSVCTIEENQVCTEAVCKIITEESFGETTCIKVLKTDVELVNKRNSEVDSILKTISNDISVSKLANSTSIKATEEKVIIGK